MNFTETEIAGVYIIKLEYYKDERGVFIKTFHNNKFLKYMGNQTFKESFFTISKMNVIRGMHFQTPPFDHGKLIYISDGKILDIVLDIRTKSLTYGKYVKIECSFNNKKAIYISPGCAHGFCVLSDSAAVHYLTTEIYNPEADTGIKWDSFGFKWPVKNPIISKRDRTFIDFNKLTSPFNY